MATTALDELPAEKRDSLMVLAYLLVQVDILDGTIEEINEDIDDAIHEPVAMENSQAMIEQSAEREGLFDTAKRMHLLRRAMVVWATQWEGEKSISLMENVREMAEMIRAAHHDEGKSTGALLTLIQGEKH